MKAITEFTGIYHFLSNYYHAPIEYWGVQFSNNEAAFQSSKCPKRRKDFQFLSPPAAKRLGQKVELRPDWEEVKNKIMYDICKEKFMQNPKLLAKLLATGDAELIEGNTWGDRVWGVCDGVGENHLGKILMRIRSELGGKR